jgi:hypothetical protein
LREPVATELLQDTTHFTKMPSKFSSFMALTSKTTGTIG